VGRIVHYVPLRPLGKHDCVAAIVTRRPADNDNSLAICLTAFEPFPNASTAIAQVQFSEEREPGTWHWPELA
jgi:hypothetical protein